mmetsp:Transcript_1658/g.4841  ORF Transcript_1658/g.4841 Transcript_1658/m.4841 type:complete len:207 (-) Transcript_1658:1380-2000(-)
MMTFITYQHEEEEIAFARAVVQKVADAVTNVGKEEETIEDHILSKCKILVCKRTTARAKAEPTSRQNTGIAIPYDQIAFLYSAGSWINNDSSVQKAVELNEVTTTAHTGPVCTKRDSKVFQQLIIAVTADIFKSVIGSENNRRVITKLDIALNQIKNLAEVGIGFRYRSAICRIAGPDAVFVSRPIGTLDMQEGKAVHLIIHVLQE